MKLSRYLKPCPHYSVNAEKDAKVKTEAGFRRHVSTKAEAVEIVVEAMR